MLAVKIVYLFGTVLSSRGGGAVTVRAASDSVVGRYEFESRHCHLT